ncbi:MAG TPA: acyltransferase [Acidimicrobiales bacterium]
MTSTLTRSAGDLAAATPTTRDRYVDFLRVASLAVVMLGHWLMAVVVWADGRIHTSNVLEVTPSARWLTWVFQVMPVFFIVGGFSNSASLAAARRKGTTYGTWLGSRLRRLVRPVLAFAVVWTAAAAVMVAAGLDPKGLRAGSIAQPLWFLAVYVVVVAAAPAMVAAQERWGAGVALGLGMAVLAIDVARWGFGVPMVGWLNLGLVWLFAHQLGVAWRTGSVGTWSRGRLTVVAAAGLGTLVVLTSTFGYPGSMVGGVEAGKTNTFPPSFAIVALAVWQFGAVLALRPVIDRWLARRRVWTTVVAANGMAMTLYLWHLTALVMVTAAVLPAGLLPSPEAGSAAWWAWRPAWIALLAVALVPLVVVFARVEAARVASTAVAGWRAVGAAAAITVAMGMLARHGFAAPGMPAGLPLVALGLLATGWWLVGARAARG